MYTDNFLCVYVGVDFAQYHFSVFVGLHALTPLNCFREVTECMKSVAYIIT